MRSWFKDGVFRAILRNAGYLGSTKLVGAGLGILALSCAGRGLGPALFGVLSLVHTYALSANALVKFQSWQLIIRYGSPALQRGDRQTVQDAIGLAIGLDIASGLVGMVAAMALLPWLGDSFGIDQRWLPLALAYCTLVPTMTALAPTGVMRLLDRFDLLAWQQLVTPLLRAGGAGIAFFGGFGFPGFVIAWYVADLAADVVIWAQALRELKRHDLLAGIRPGLFAPARRLPDAWSFVWTTNISSSLNAGWGPIGNLIVGGVLGPVAAGLYRIAATLIDSAGKPAELLTKGFYPEIMRLDPSSRRPWRLALRTGALAGGIGLLVVLLILVGGKPLIGLVFGRRYLDAYQLMSLMMFALMVSMASFPLQSLLYMVGRQRAALAAQAAAMACYLALLAVLAKLLGLAGAGIAYVLGNGLLALFMLVPVMMSYRSRERYRPAPPLPDAEP